jgi:DNA-binding transcriptional ArsR family regulator
MASRSNRPIAHPRQLRAVASPVRQEVLDLLARAGPMSAAELGRLLQRPADGLYYHLRALGKVGLIAEEPGPSANGRSEARFRTVAAEPALRHDPSPKGNSKQVTAIVASMLRLGARDFRAAAARTDVRTEGARRELWALRAVGWLSPADLAGVNAKMQGLRDAVARRPAGGQLYGVTILLTPLSHRGRKPQRRPRAARGRERS